jgi:HSP20 family molecular chaperone IbpA
MDKQDLATQPTAAAHSSDPGAPYPFIPPADVLEDSAGITIRLDMPGVTKERLSIEADRNTLVIEGEVQIAMPQGMDPLYAEIQSTRYRRSFTLSGELDAEHTAANLSNGVLTVTIPLRAELRPRKVEVRIG